MTESLFGGVDKLHGVLNYHLERHNVLASNIAHVDTPGYVPHDVERADSGAFDGALSAALTGTDPRHYRTEPTATAGGVGRVFEDASGGAGNDGNYVSLDREAAKVGANSVRYDVVSAIVQAQLEELSKAAADGRG